MIMINVLCDRYKCTLTQPSWKLKLKLKLKTDLSKMIFSFLTLVLVLFHGAVSKPNYCIPSNTTCWPTSDEISDFSSKLTGKLLFPDSPGYTGYNNVTNTRTLEYPSFIVAIKNVNDIQASILFAKQHNIQITIFSTGHAFNGANTGNNTLQINLKDMQSYKLSDDNNYITVETGIQWHTIYQIVDKINKVAVGGSCPTVGPGMICVCIP